MHLSGLLVECATECARLSRQCEDKKIGFALFEISARLFAAAAQEAELVMDGTRAALQPALHRDPAAGE